MAPDTGTAGRVAILLPHRERFGPLSAGAVAMVVRRLASGVSRYRSVVVGPAFEGPRFAGIEFRAVGAAWLPLSATLGYAVRAAAVLARLPVCIIEVHNKPDVALWLARVFPRRRVILVLHNDPRSMRGARGPAARRRLLRRLARVVVVSGYVRDALLEGVAAPGLAPVVIHNALDLTALPLAEPMAGREKLVLFAGRVVPDKGADAFVAAWALVGGDLPGWRAAIIGTDGFSAGAPDSAFMRRLRPEAVAAGVEMRGFQPHDAVLAAMARAAIVAVPSRWQEPFGLTALEAMACGAALLCSRRGGLAEVVGEACVPIDPDDVAGFARALRLLADDPRRRAALSEAGQARARALFSGVDALSRLDAVRAQSSQQ